MEQNDITIYVATHKKLDIKFPDGYIPMQVNCANTGEHWPGYFHDDFGDQISEKNPNYCELTVLYSAWKNCHSKVKGLVHYRRYLYNNPNVEFNKHILCDLEHLEDDVLSISEIDKLIYGENYDILFAAPLGPYPDTARQELEKFCYSEDIQILEDIIRSDYPEYLPYFETALASKTLYYFNMMIAKGEVFDRYCEWVFDVLAKAESKCNIADYDTQHKRIYGYFAEVLLDVYFEKNHVPRKFLGMTSPYQFVGGNRALYLQQQKRRKQTSTLRKLHMFGIVELFYKIRSPQMYNKYRACKGFVEKQSLR